MQLISNRSFKLNAIPDDQGYISSLNIQRLLDNKAKALTIKFNLIKDIQPKIVAELKLSRKLTSDYNIKLRLEIPLGKYLLILFINDLILSVDSN